MAMKHRITINVTDPSGRKAAVLRGAERKLPARLMRFLFGDFLAGADGRVREHQ